MLVQKLNEEHRTNLFDNFIFHRNFHHVKMNDFKIEVNFNGIGFFDFGFHVIYLRNE